MEWHWPGTWREREAMHDFAQFVTIPEQSGGFRSYFWHDTVLRSCIYSASVFFAATAIGALYHHVRRQARGTSQCDHTGLSFALEQCNRSINLLTSDSHHTRGAGLSRDKALITCVLFTVFEAMHGEIDIAIAHATQGRSLLRVCEATWGQHSADDGFSRLVDPTHVYPVLSSIELYARTLQGDGASWKKKGTGKHYPTLPDSTVLHSLDHAHWSLHYVFVRLKHFSIHQPLNLHDEDTAHASAVKDSIYSPWLAQWKQSFVDFLYRSAPTLSPFDLEKAKILKVNQIAMAITARADFSRKEQTQSSTDDDRARVRHEYKTIIDLTRKVLDTYHGDESLTFPFSLLSWGLWVMEPLFITLARCPDPVLRRQAAALAIRRSQMERSKHSTDAKLNSFNSFVTPERRDTDAWGPDEWVEFASSVRLDVAMSTFFRQLPSDHIPRPQYAFQTSPWWW